MWRRLVLLAAIPREDGEICAQSAASRNEPRMPTASSRKLTAVHPKDEAGLVAAAKRLRMELLQAKAELERKTA
jgi:hypothetical protein